MEPAKAAGSVMVTGTSKVHPLASTTVTVIAPAERLLNVPDI